jgi:sugar/nucleoside kinase (ribokinase family)
VTADPPLVAVIGDCLMDVVVRPAAANRPGADVRASIALAPGGQGANVAVRLARRGTRVRLIAAVAADAAGSLLREAMAADGVELRALASDATGIVAAFVDPDGERTMYSERRDLDPAAAVEAAGGATWVHVSGYALLGDAGGALAAGLAGRFVSVNGGSAAARDGRAGQLARHLATLRPALLVLSAQEAAGLAGDELSATPSYGDVAAHLAERFRSVVVVTMGEAGAVAASPAGDIVAVPAVPTRAVDSTGAGDAFAAGLIDDLLRTVGGPGPAVAWPPNPERLRTAMRAGATLAARVITVIGAQTRFEGEQRATVEA